MSILGFLLLGFGAGAIAKALHRGPEPGGAMGTFVVGVLGALLGGLLATAAGIGSLSSFFSLGTWLIAIVGAFALLLLYEALASRASGRRQAGSF